MDEIKLIVNTFNSIKLENYDEYLQRENNGIYHYTSSNVFLIILKNNTLRFTDRFFLNDKSEGSYVLDLCLELIKEKLSKKM